MHRRPQPGPTRRGQGTHPPERHLRVRLWLCMCAGVCGAAAPYTASPIHTARYTHQTAPSERDAPHGIICGRGRAGEAALASPLQITCHLPAPLPHLLSLSPPPPLPPRQPAAARPGPKRLRLRPDRCGGGGSRTDCRAGSGSGSGAGAGARTTTLEGGRPLPTAGESGSAEGGVVAARRRAATTIGYSYSCRCRRRRRGLAPALRAGVELPVLIWLWLRLRLWLWRLRWCAEGGGDAPEP
eukprot:COSAG01_NODE_11294_length_1964_cov_19.272386_1_plen_241_part_00